MKLISIGTDRKIFEAGSTVRSRVLEYGKLFEELHLIVFTNDKSHLADMKIAENVFIYPTNSRSKLLYILDAILISRKIIKTRGRLETVFSAQDPFETGLTGLLLKFFYRLPLQIQVHTDFANKYFIFHSFLNIIRFAIAEVVLSFADSVRVVSKRIADSVHNDPKYVTVLPVYINQDNRQQTIDNRPEKETKEKNESKISFLTVARLESEKNIETAIRAFKEVLVSGLDAEFVVVGDGGERENLEKLCEDLGIEEKVIFAGWKDGGLTDFYKEADIYVSTSFYEGYGMSIVQAALSQLPLVISETGVAGEIFFDKKEAFICKSGEVAKFAGAMRTLASDAGLRERMGQAAKLAATRAIMPHAEYTQMFRKSVQDAYESGQTGGVFKKNILLRYVVAGLTGATTNIGLLYIFTDLFGIWYLASSILSFISAIAVSFTLQKFWTFADKGTDKMANQFGRYMVLAICGVLINTACVFVLVDIFHVWYILAQILAGAVIMVFNFIMYKFFIFQKR